MPEYGELRNFMSPFLIESLLGRSETFQWWGGRVHHSGVTGGGEWGKEIGECIIYRRSSKWFIHVVSTAFWKIRV